VTTTLDLRGAQRLFWGATEAQRLYRGSTLLWTKPGSPPPPPPWTPASAGAWVWIDPSDLSTMRQDRTGAAATIPVAVGDPVGSLLDKGQFGGWWTALTDAARPTLQSSGGLFWLAFSNAQRLTATATPGFMAAMGGNMSKTLVASTATTGSSSNRFLFQLGNAAPLYATIQWPTTNLPTLHQNGQNLIETDGPTMAALQVHTFLKNVNALSIRTNGAERAAANVSAVNIPATDTALNFGGRSNNSNFWNGPVHSLALYPGALSGADLIAAETFAAARAGLSL
jgi:hypothetical protein